jgi:hypothetical protein
MISPAPSAKPWFRTAPKPPKTTAIALARFDERLSRANPVLAEGARQRGHAFEAQTLIGLSGGLCPLEDLCLHDAGMDVRSPTREIARAAAILDERRRLARREPDRDFEPKRPAAAARD